MIKPMLANVKNQDQALPKADTCFFNIELPDYSTKQIMKEKILLAVNLDNVSINADDNINNEDNPLMNEIDSYDQDEDYDEENIYGGGGG
jgi:other hect domain ubiquitin protein ligase E3